MGRKPYDGRDLELYHITRSYRSLMDKNLQTLLELSQAKKLDYQSFRSQLMGLTHHFEGYKQAREEHDQLPGSPTDCL